MASSSKKLTAKRSNGGLNEMQARFCREFLIDRNASKAAIRAGYSPNGVEATASKLLTVAKVADRINALISLQEKRLDIKADEILKELRRVGMSDVRELYKEDGTVKHPKEWPDDLARAVSSIEVEELFEFVNGEKVWIGYTKKIKLWSKTQALDMLGKHKKLFTDRVELDVSDNLAEKIAAARARAATAKLPEPDSEE